MIYFLRRPSDGYIKIGFTDAYTTRLNALRKQHGDLELLGALPGDLVREKELHIQFAGLRINRTEWFKPESLLTEYIREHTREQPINDTVRIRLGTPAVRTLKKMAIDAGYDSFSEYLRSIIGQHTGVNTTEGISTWGGAGRKDKSE